MASAAVVTAVETRLAANWATCPIRTINEDATPPADGGAFLVVQYPVANEEQMSIGSPGANVWREEGAFRIVIHGERGQGKDTYLGWADTLRALFRGKTFDGVQCFEASPATEDQTNEDGNYYKLSFAVAYDYDLIG